MRRLPKLVTFTIALLFCVALGVKGYVLQVPSGLWAPQANLGQARSGASIALLKDGRLVVTGGDGSAGTLGSAEIIGLDGASSAVAPMGIARSRHISAVLSNGSVLVAGGTTSGGGATNAAEIYDPVADSWSTLAGGMIEARSNATSVLLQDGRVLIVGGEKFGVASSTIEIFDPATLVFSFAGVLASPRTEHAVALLTDGRVIIVGGSSGTAAVNSTDIYDPVGGNVSAGPVMSTPRSGHSATLMLDGRVLIAGGNNGSADLTSAEIFDPATNTIAPVASPLSTPRQGHLAFLLPNNNTILIAGGTSAGAPLASAEVFTPWLGVFTSTGSLSSARSMSVGSAMKQDGLLLTAGGQDASGVAVANQDLYGFATVKTDQADYPPGTTVNITGSGWQPGEIVTLTLIESPLFDTHGPFAVAADANGSISDSSFVTDEHDLNINFLVTAVGSASQAQTAFKDSKPNTVSVGAQNPDPIAPGGSAQYTVTVNFNGNGTLCTSPLSIQNPALLPTGATASFSPTSLTSTGGNATSTLTIATTSSTPPTSIPISFTVLAGNGAGCQAGTATGTGSLAIVESTTTTLSSSVNPSVFGQSTTLTATVAKTSGPTTPNAGTVTFKDGATSLGTGTLNASGVATLGVASLTAGSHNLTASYAGTAIFGGSTSNTVSQTVNQTGSLITVASGTNPSASGQSVLFTATVAAVAPGSGTATGTVTFKDGAATIGTGTLAGNAATLAISTLTVGSHSITATYNGDTNFTGSTSSAVSQTVNQASTAATITAHTPGPSMVGQAVTITFTVTGASGTPTGNVTVSDGAGDSCTATVAVGNCSITFPASGTKTLSAVYAGDSNFTGSTSPNVSHTVNAAATTTTITAHTPNASVIGQPITVNYSVAVNSPGSGSVPGTDNVTVSDGTGDSCTAAVAIGTCQLTPTTSGAKTLTATFATGDINFATSASAGVSHTVNKRATTTSVILSLTTAVVGQASSATVTVTDTDFGTQTNPTGVVTLTSSDFGDAFGVCTLAPSGSSTATCTASVTPSKVGTNPHTVTSTFPADATHATSNGTASLTVNKANTTTTISSNTPNPSTVGQNINVNFTVTVNSPGAGALTGNVTVSDGVGNTCNATAAAGSCQITIGTAGSKTLTATYAGDANFLTSASAGTSQTVNPKLAITSNTFATLTGICSSPITVQTQNADGSAANQAAARTLSPSSSSANGTFFSDSGCSTQVNSVTIAAGASTVNFFYNDSSIGSPAITVASTGLAAAVQTEGETGLRFSTAAFTSPVGQCSTAMTLQSANAQSGGPTSLSQGTTIGLNTSSVGGKFYSDATCATQITSVVIGPGFDAGHDSPNFFYKDTTAGSALVTGSAGTASATQMEAITKVTLVFTVPASQSITFGTASITVSGTLAVGTLFPPSGETVSITINSAATTATIGTSGSFSAIINTSAIPASATSYVITYSYVGDTNFNSATNNATTLTVNRATTSTFVVSSLNPSFSGQQVTFTGTITVPAGVPSGTVQFQDGGVNLGSALALTNIGGVFSAQLQTSGLSVGNHSITAVYSGDTNFSGSTSSVLMQTVKSAATSTSISAPTITYGADGVVTVTMAAQDPSAGTPTGSVTLSVDGGTAFSQSLVNGSTTFTILNLSAGDHSLSANYAAQNNFNASSATDNLHVNQAIATLSFGTLTFTYDGSPKPVTVTTTPANLPGITVLYNGGTTPPTNAGTTPVTATLMDPNYAATPIGGSETIQAAPVVITISDPMPTYDGNPHQATITVVPLVSLTVTYNGGAVPPTNAGIYVVSVTTIDSNYAGVGSGNLTIKQGQPTITWSNPADISFGTALSGTQLNATSNVPGAFVYSPSAGTLLDAGDGQTLTADFTPTDAVDYAAVPGTHVLINVKAKALYIVSSDGSRAFGQPNPTFTPTFIGLANGDTPSSVGAVACQSAAGTSSAPGTYAANCFGVNSMNYSAHYIAGTLSVTNPLSVISEIKGVNSSSETLTIGQSDLLTATGKFTDASTRALSVAGGSSYGKMPLLTPVSGAAIAEAGGALYAIGGFDGTNTLATIQAYDPKNDSWTVLPNSIALATPRTNAAVVSVAGRIYVIGGTDVANHPLASVEVLDTTGADPVVSVFSASLSTARSASGAAAFNNKLYVVGGSDSSNNPLSSVEIFDLVTGAVSTNDADTALAQASASVVNKNNAVKLYVVGVSGSSVVLVTFDGSTWSNPVSTSLSAAQGVGATSFGELLYLVNGADVWSYDGSSFTKKNSLSNSHSGTHPVSIGSLLYAASAGSGLPDSKLDAFAPDEVKWTSADNTKATVDQTGNVFALAITSPTVTVTAASLADPNISANFLLTIIRKAQTIQFATLSPKIYGDADFNVSATSVDSTLTPTGLLVDFAAGSTDACTVGTSTLSAGVSSATVHVTKAGSCTITATQSGDATTWLPATSDSQTFAIAKANAVIVVTPYSVTYDGDAHTATGTSTGVQNESLAGMNLTGTTHTVAGDYPGDAWTFTDVTGNYNNASGTIYDVIAKANAVVAVTPYSVTYDGDPHTATGTAKGAKGETLAGLNLSGTTHTNAGDYASDAWTFTDVTGNYNSASGTTHDAIAKANAVVVVTPYSATYDGDPHTATGTAKGAKGETLAGLNLSGTTHTNAGDYPSDAWTFTDVTENYNNANGTTHDVIAKANAAIIVTPYSVIYDGNAHSATGAATGVKAENLSGLNLSGTTHTTAGTYAGDNWTFTDVTGNYNNAGSTVSDSIAKAPASVTPAVAYKIYGANDPTLTGTLAGFIAADHVTAVYTRTTGETVGGSPYTISATLAPASVLGNYDITYNSASFAIMPAPLNITASSGPMIYGGPVFPVTPTYIGFVNGDTVSSLTAAASCSTQATSATPVGVYVSFCSGVVDGNYVISYVNGIVTVNQATTTTTAVSSVNPSTFMQLVTFTATVTPAFTGVPTGTVAFFSNGSPIGTGTLGQPACGTPPCPVQATLNISSLPDVGPDSITAVYAGDTNFITSTSPAITQIVQPAPNVVLSPMSVSFGNQNVNTTSKPAIVTLTNIGDATLNINAGGISVNPSGDFAQTNNCGATVLAGKSCTISVTFTPVDTGVRTASLQITDNDDDATNAQQTVSLTGSGLSTIPGTSLFTNAIFATANGCGSIVMSGGSTVDSFNSTLGYAASHQNAGGNVGTNGNVTLNGNKSAIYGSAAVPSTTTGNCGKATVTGITSNGGAQVTGGAVALNGPITYPTPPPPNPVPPTTTQNISGSCGAVAGCSNTGSKTVTLIPGQYGNLSFSGGTIAHFSKGMYNINSLNLTGQSVLFVDSGPVVVNLAGALLNGGNPVMDSTGGSIQNPSGNPENLQFSYAGSRGLNLSGGAASYATVYAPNALVNMSGNSDFFGSIIASTLTNSGSTAIHYDTTLPTISSGNYIWFNAVVNNVKGLPATGQVKLYLTNSFIQYTAGATNCTTNAPCTLALPNSVVTFNSTTGLGTTFSTTSNRWSTSVPKASLTGNTFVTGVAFRVPANLPAGIENVTWSASYSTDTPGISLQWQWGAAVYTSFNSCYAYQNTNNSASCYNAVSNANVLGVNAEDGSADLNGSDPAGTPETYKASVTFGATGGGGTNYVGFLTPGAGIVPTVAPMSVSPSSLDFGAQSQGTTSGSMISVLTNNDSLSHAISSISITGTNASNFTLLTNGANNCLGMSSLASGSSCTLYVTFTPSDVGTRTAKVGVNDDANNSPQTVYLSGAGQ